MDRPALGPGLVFLAMISLGCASPMMQDAPVMSRPTPGKALVKFHRLGGYAAPGLGGSSLLFGFPLWDGGTLIGESAAGYTVQYECEPGEHVFIADSEGRNMSAVRARLQAGNVYDIVAQATFCFWKPGVKLLPVTPDSRHRKKLARYDRKLKHVVLDPTKAAEYEARRRPWMLKTVAHLERGEMDRIVGELKPEDGRFTIAEPVAPGQVVAAKAEPGVADRAESGVAGKARLGLEGKGIALEFESITRREGRGPLRMLIGAELAFTIGVGEDMVMGLGSASMPIYLGTRPFPREEGSTNGLLVRAGVGGGVVGASSGGTSVSMSSWNASAGYFWAGFEKDPTYPDKVTGKGFHVGVAVMGTEAGGIRTTSDPSPEFGFDMFNFNPSSEKWSRITIMVLPLEDFFVFGVTTSHFF